MHPGSRTIWSAAPPAPRATERYWHLLSPRPASSLPCSIARACTLSLHASESSTRAMHSSTYYENRNVKEAAKLMGVLFSYRDQRSAAEKAGSDRACGSCGPATRGTSFLATTRHPGKYRAERGIYVLSS